MAGGQNCVATGCTNSYHNSSCSFFRFPKDIERARIWAIASGRSDLLENLQNLHHTSRLCGYHFENRMFLNELKNRIQRDAIPTVFPGQDPPSIPLPEISQQPLPKRKRKNKRFEFGYSESPKVYMINAAQTPPVIINADQRVISESVVAKGTPSTIKQSQSSGTSGTANRLNSTAMETFRSASLKLRAKEVKKSNKTGSKAKDARYSTEFKNYCLSLYFLGPKLYRKTFANKMSLPGVKSLKNLLWKTKLLTGINEEAFAILKAKFQNFGKLNKLCTICVGEMDLKPNLFYGTTSDKIFGLEDLAEKQRVFKTALKALVVMARGLNSDWEQPISYYFLGGASCGQKLTEIILQTITKIKEIGLHVVAIVSKMNRHTLQVMNLLAITPQSPHFVYENQDVTFLFDTPHLLRSTRNSLMVNRFVTDTESISWSYLQDFHFHDRQFTTRAVPQLTEFHVDPNRRQKREIEYASQIFSGNVATSMNLYLRFGALPQQAGATVEFIRRMSDLFATLNSLSKRKAYRGSEWQTSFLIECYNLFNNLRIISQTYGDITQNTRWILGWKTNISAILHLWDVLKEHGVPYFQTGKINEDCLLKFFQSIRKQCDNRNKPTPVRFYRAFKKIFCSSVMCSGIQHWEENYEEALLKIINLPSKRYEIDDKNLNKSSEKDYQNDYLLQSDFAKHICTYLIKKALMKHACQTCEDYAKQYQKLDDITLVCYTKVYEDSEYKLVEDLYASHEDFIYFVASMEILFQQSFEDLSCQDNIVREYTTTFNKLNYRHPCPSFPYDYVAELYAKVRLFYTIKLVNSNKFLARRNVIAWK